MIGELPIPLNQANPPSSSRHAISAARSSESDFSFSICDPSFAAISLTYSASDRSSAFSDAASAFVGRASLTIWSRETFFMSASSPDTFTNSPLSLASSSSRDSPLWRMEEWASVSVCTALYTGTETNTASEPLPSPSAMKVSFIPSSLISGTSISRSSESAPPGSSVTSFMMLCIGFELR